MIELIDHANKMATLFRGFAGGYGTYDARLLSKAEGKQKVPQSMVKQPPTFELFEAHLSGVTPMKLHWA